MAGVSMSAYEQMEDVLGTWRFLLSLTLPSALGGQEATRDLLLRCQQCVVPGVTVEQMLVGLHGHERTFRGRVVYSKTMSVTFLETRSGVTEKWLRTWCEGIVGSDSGNGLVNDEYATRGTLEVLDTSTGKVTATHKIEKVWIQDLPEVQLDGTGSNAYLRACTFSFDRFIMDGIGVDVGGEAATI